jgi:hypothetical protein
MCSRGWLRLNVIFQSQGKKLSGMPNARGEHGRHGVTRDGQAVGVLDGCQVFCLPDRFGFSGEYGCGGSKFRNHFVPAVGALTALPCLKRPSSSAGCSPFAETGSRPGSLLDDAINITATEKAGMEGGYFSQLVAETGRQFLRCPSKTSPTSGILSRAYEPFSSHRICSGESRISSAERLSSSSPTVRGPISGMTGNGCAMT